MEKSSKRGKIPQSDWPLIMARYDAGETLASIARTYDCSPPAISYVVSRSRARQPDTDTAQTGAQSAEPQLLKTVVDDGSAATVSALPGGAPAAPAEAAVAAPPQRPPAARPEAGAAAVDSANGSRARGAEPPQQGNGSGRPAGSSGLPGSAAPPLPQQPSPPLWQQRPRLPTANGDQRRTLHLSLGAPPHSSNNGGVRPSEQPGYGDRNQPSTRPADRRANGGTSEPAPAVSSEVARPADVLHDGDAASARDRRPGGGAFIDRELRARVEGDIAAFLAAFDAALAQDTLENRAALREATDRLLRAGARTRIELERLEARMPLAGRDREGRANPAWRER